MVVVVVVVGVMVVVVVVVVMVTVVVVVMVVVVVVVVVMVMVMMVVVVVWWDIMCVMATGIRTDEAVPRLLSRACLVTLKTACRAIQPRLVPTTLMVLQQA